MWQEALKEKEHKGDLTIGGAIDVLTLALGTPEHNGRVQGVGGYVQPNQYFNLPRRRKESVNETLRLSVKQILDKEREKIEVEIREKVLAEEKEKIAAAERAFWVSRIEQLEAKLYTSCNEGIANTVGDTQNVGTEHVSVQASCSKTHDTTVRAAKKKEKAGIWNGDSSFSRNREEVGAKGKAKEDFKGSEGQGLRANNYRS